MYIDAQIRQRRKEAEPTPGVEISASMESGISERSDSESEQESPVRDPRLDLLRPPNTPGALRIPRTPGTKWIAQFNCKHYLLN